MIRTMNFLHHQNLQETRDSYGREMHLSLNHPASPTERLPLASMFPKERASDFFIHKPSVKMDDGDYIYSKFKESKVHEVTL
jgi:hypothetical protein